MPDYSSRSVCVVDNGLFVELAVTLAKSFGRVYYFSPWVSAFPKSNDLLIGRGIPGVRKVDSIWPILDQVDLWCFDDQTEVLTERGWRRFADLDGSESVATLRLSDRSLEYQRPTRYIRRRFTGEMVMLETARVNLCVTPQHRLYVRRPGNKEFGLELAATVAGHSNMEFAKSACWTAPDLPTWTIPAHRVAWSVPHWTRKFWILRSREWPEATVPTDAFLALVGFFIAEGSVGRRNAERASTIEIGQKDRRTLCDLEREITQLGVRFTVQPRGKQFYVLRIHDAQWATYFERFGKNAADKHVPADIKALSARQLKILWDWYVRGDGFSTGCGCSTVSRQLAHDLSEIALKIGYSTSERPIASSEMLSPKTRRRYRSASGYRLNISRSESYQTPSIAQRSAWRTRAYDGDTYCVSVPNGVIYVRRHGVALWAGNCFPDIYDGPLQEHLVSLGKRVWGSRHGEELELDRVAAKEHMRGLGIPIGPYQVVRGLDNLRAYLREHPKTYTKISRTRGDFESFRSETYDLIEPKLDELEHVLGAKKKVMEFVVEDAIDEATEVGFDGYTVDGQFPTQAMVGVEVKDKAYVGLFQRYAEMPPQIRMVNERLAPTLKRYGYRNFLSVEMRITKDGTPWVIDPCFSEDTEVLTRRGWKRFPDLKADDDVCTMDPATRAIEYQRPTDYLARPYAGEMVLITNRRGSIECLVTPNHNVWRTDRNGHGLVAERADSLTDKGYIPRTGRWHGEAQPIFTLPAYHHAWVSGRGRGVQRTKQCPPLPIPMADWLRFLALYLSEGSRHSKWSINIAQHTHLAEVEAVLRALPFSVTRARGGFLLHSRQLAHHLWDSGLCHEKRVPDYVKRLSPDLIRIFLDAYRLGDGNVHRGQSLYFTTSPGMADDLQELVLKTGHLANIRVTHTKGTMMRAPTGREYQRRHDVHVVAEVPKQDRFWFEAGGRRREQYIRRVPYSGMVYDVTVPNHTLYVRRNGKPFWSSNCCRLGAPPNELCQIMYTNWPDILWYGAQGELVDPIPAGTWGAELLILSDWADKNWQAVAFPERYRDHVKLRNLTIIEGRYYVVPRSVGLPEIGAVVAVGATMDEAIRRCREIADTVEGYFIEVPATALDNAEDEIEKLKAYGIAL